MLLYKPRPEYIDERGSVSKVMVIRGLPHGLSEQAVKAAFQLKFRPAMKDGEPVKTRKRVTMDFMFP